MRIESIELSWFRGAGPQVSLETRGKNIVVYGANGSGKSSFADALEYIVANGKIAHLSHEYSGPKQREGIRNTHAPKDASSQISISFQNRRQIIATIDSTGNLTFTCDPPGTTEVFQCYDLERFILRQDEVAKFIHATKGVKYSVLLPLLGLEDMEQAALNLHNLQNTIKVHSNLDAKQQQLRDHKVEVLKYLPNLAPQTVLDKLNTLATTYLETPPPQEPPPLIDALQEAVTNRINDAEPEQKRHLIFNQIEDDDLKGKLTTLIEVKQYASEMVDELINRQIAVIESADTYIQNVDDDSEKFKCPACGRDIKFSVFADHVRSELDTLKEFRAKRNELINARKNVVSSIKQLNRKVETPEISDWLGKPEQENLNEALIRVSRLEIDEDEVTWDAQIWATLQQDIPLIHNDFSTAASSTPPSTQELIQANQIIESCQKVPEISRLENEIYQIDRIITWLYDAELAVREAIKERTKNVIEGVSNEVQTLWEKLHPDEPIEAVQLYIPKDADKAIDICLKFFGVDQPSPRLSLSEGHRNSLGLCIFLALVKLDDVTNRPIVLDDVVSSLDREHRGMLAKILLEDLADRQTIVLTHDREWYSELRARLPAKHWEFLALKPWQDPEVGIQWSNSKETFDDARSLMEINPTTAGNRARAIMDSQMAIAAERLYITVNYLRGDRNDHRTCIEFLERTISMAQKSIRKKQGKEYPIYTDPLMVWEEARNLLVSWGNRASHTGRLTHNEAEELIKVCEKAIAYFRCTDCGDPIWIADQISRKRLQCSCGMLQWRYG